MPRLSHKDCLTFDVLPRTPACRLLWCQMFTNSHSSIVKIRHVLDFRHLVIVRRDDGVQLLFERKNFLCQRLEPTLRHRAARMNLCNIGHKTGCNRLPPRINGVN